MRGAFFSAMGQAYVEGRMKFRTIRWLSCVAAVVGLGLLVMAPAASAQTAYPTTTPSTTTVSCTGQTTVQVCGTSVTTPSQSTDPFGSLAFTGGNIALLVGLGLVLAVGGVVLVRLGRRSRAAA